MAMVINGTVGPQTLADGANAAPRLLPDGSVAVTEIHGRYYEMAKRGNLFTAHAIVTAPVIYSTAAGTGGPLLWNGSNKNAVLLAMGFGLSVVTTVAAALGIATGTGQTSAPGSTTAIDSSGNCLVGAAGPGCSVYRIGTPTNAASRFIPLAHLHTGALTVDTAGIQWVDLGGLIVVPPNCWASPSVSATASTTVAHISLIWAEVPV